MALKAVAAPLGSPVGGSGTTNTIPRWTGPSTLGDSGLIDDGSVIYTTARNAAFGSTSSAGYRARVLAAAGAGSAFGLRIDAGTNSTDYALRIANQATTSDYLAVRGDGNVGIGTASPGTRLHVNAGGGIRVTDATGTSGFDMLNIGLDAYLYNRNNGLLVFGANNTARMRINSVGATEADSQVAIGTTSFTSGCSLTVAKSIDCSQSSQGLKLPATPGNGNANTLDAYVDGGAGSGGATFTATMKGTTSDPTTPVTVTGNYVLVGKMLTLNIYFDNVDTTGAAGSVYITTNLAAALRPASRSVGNCGVYLFSTGGASQGTFVDLRTAGELYIMTNLNNGGWSGVTYGAGAGRYLMISATYIIP